MAGMSDYRIVEDDLTGPQVISLLAFHLGEMHALSPACKVHAMPVERLRQPDVTFYSAWDGDRLAAVGALREIEPGRGELKSMRAAPEFRGKGAARIDLSSPRPGSISRSAPTAARRSPSQAE